VIIDKNLEKASQLANALPHSIPGEVKVAVAKNYDDACKLPSPNRGETIPALSDVFIVASSYEMDYLIEQESRRRRTEPIYILWSSNESEQRRAKEAGLSFVSRKASAEAIGKLIKAKTMGTAF